MVVLGELDEEALLGAGENVPVHKLERVLGFSPRIKLHERRAPADGGLRVHQGPALDDLAVLVVGGGIGRFSGSQEEEGVTQRLV